MNIKSILLGLVIIFIISYAITTFNSTVVYTKTDNVFLLDPTEYKPLYHTFKDFRQYYSECLKIDDFVFKNKEIHKIKEDCNTIYFDRDYYSSNNINIEPERSKLLSKHNFVQDKGIVRMRNKYSSNTDIDRSLAGKLKIIDDYYCPAGGVKEWALLNDNIEWMGIYAKPSTHTDKEDSYFNYYEKDKIHKIKIDKELLILVNVKDKLPFWYSFDSGSGGQARVLEFSLTDDISTIISQRKEE